MGLIGRSQKNRDRGTARNVVVVVWCGEPLHRTPPSPRGVCAPSPFTPVPITDHWTPIQTCPSGGTIGDRMRFFLKRKKNHSSNNAEKRS